MPKTNDVRRRAFLKATSSIASALPFSAFGSPAPYEGKVEYEVANAGREEAAKPKDHIKFAVIGTDHNHILGITAALQRGGGELVSVYSTDPGGLAEFQKRFGDVKVAKSEDEILNDPSIQLVASAAIVDLRAPLGIRVMRHGKDFLSDKPGMATLEQLADVRKAIKETNRIYGILYSERLEVKAAVK